MVRGLYTSSAASLSNSCPRPFSLLFSFSLYRTTNVNISGDIIYQLKLVCLVSGTLHKTLMYLRPDNRETLLV